MYLFINLLIIEKYTIKNSNQIKIGCFTQYLFVFLGKFTFTSWEISGAFKSEQDGDAAFLQNNQQDFETLLLQNSK